MRRRRRRTRAAFDAWSDDLVIRAIAPVPCASHAAVRALARRFRDLLASAAFAQAVEEYEAEKAVADKAENAKDNDAEPNPKRARVDA